MSGETLPEFRPWPKIPRWNRPAAITEKLDGTNACVIVTEDGNVFAQSRKRIITPEADNYGFARWADDHAEELRELGEGYHFGEWWGLGIQRGYGLDEKRFSLFNFDRWEDPDNRPACCEVVPVLWRGSMGAAAIAADACVARLRITGSLAAPGFEQPEGIVVFHYSGNVSFKRLLEGDDEPKGLAA